MVAHQEREDPYQIPYSSTVKSVFNRLPSGQITLTASGTPFEDNAFFQQIRPLALDAFNISLDGTMTFEEIRDYVITKRPNTDILLLIELLNHDKRHFTKNVQRFALSSGTVNATYRKTRATVPVVKFFDWSTTPEEELNKGNITQAMCDLLKKNQVPSPYMPPIRTDNQGRAFIHPSDQQMLDFLKTHAVVFKRSTNSIEFRGFEVKLEEVPEPLEPSNIETLSRCFRETLTPILIRPHSYLAIVTVMEKKFPAHSTEFLRSVLKYTLASRPFGKFERSKIEGDVYKTLSQQTSPKELLRRFVKTRDSDKNENVEANEAGNSEKQISEHGNPEVITIED